MFYYRFVRFMQFFKLNMKDNWEPSWVKLSCENIGMCLSYVPFTLVIQLINCWDFIRKLYDNKMLSSQWDNDNQHFVYIIVSWYLLGIITRQGFLFSCSCMNRCTCLFLQQAKNNFCMLNTSSIFITNEHIFISGRIFFIVICRPFGTKPFWAPMPSYC